jgi:hypothetical protein
MKAQYVYESLEFERGRDPKSTLQIGITQKLKEIIPEIIEEIYMAHERDIEYIESELEGEEFDKFVEAVESEEINKYFYPMEYMLDDAEVDGVEDSFNLILKYPELSEPIANEYVKETGSFSGVKIEEDYILTWWGPEDGEEFPWP